MPLITKYHTFSDGTIPAGLITAVRLNTNWDRLYTLVNGMLDNDNMEDGYSLLLSAATAPAWTSSYTGKVVYAEDTGYLHYGTGSALVRLAPYVYFPTVVAGALIYGSATPAWAALAANATATKMVLTMTSSVPAWGNMKLDDLDTPDDNTDLNASTGAHGLLPKLSNVATEYLDGTGAWSTPQEDSIETAVGTTVTIQSLSMKNFGLTDYTKRKEIRINEEFSGTITVSWEHRISNALGTTTTRLYFNGVAQGAEKTTQSETFVAVSETLTDTFVDGDLIQIYGKVDNGSYTGEVEDLEIKYKWVLKKVAGWTLSTALDLSDTTAVSTTNQDPA